MLIGNVQRPKARISYENRPYRISEQVAWKEIFKKIKTVK